MQSSTSPFYLENEIIYIWIWGRKIKDKNSGQELRIKIIYLQNFFFFFHIARGVTLASPAGFVSCTMSDIPGDALVLFAKRTVEHWLELLLFKFFK